jgi:predicted transposase YdaD
VSPELIELLKYMEHSTDEVSEVCKSERIQKIHRRICQIKASEKTEVKYMQSWEEKILIKQEGIAEGRLEEKQELMRKLSNKFSIEQIAEMLEIDISEVENIIKELAK